MDRRGFIGRLIAGCGGLVAGQTVSIVEAKESDLQAVDGFMLPVQGPELWIHSIMPEIGRDYLDVTTPSSLATRQYLKGMFDARLTVQFRGPGCIQLAHDLYSKIGTVYRTRDVSA